MPNDYNLSATELVLLARHLKHDPPESARRMALAYPRFQRIFDHRPWDAELFYLAVAPCSGAERDAAAFVLDLWNTDCIPELDGGPEGHGLGSLNIIRAMSRWDDYHRLVFLAWARDPWWL